MQRRVPDGERNPVQYDFVEEYGQLVVRVRGSSGAAAALLASASAGAASSGAGRTQHVAGARPRQGAAGRRRGARAQHLTRTQLRSCALVKHTLFRYLV